MVHTSSSTSAAAEVTSEMQDANTALIASNRALYGNNMSSSVHNTPLSHAAYSPVATAKSALDSTPPLMYDSPPPAFPSELYAYDISSSGGGGVGVGIGSTNEGGSSALSNKLLHEAFASLSLTDKCALSLSMSQSQQQGGGASPTPGSSKGGSKANTPRTSKVNLSNISLGALEGSMGLGMGLGIGISGGGLSGGGSLNTSSASVCGNVDEMSEIQSVLSETDKESLDVAMSMMGHFELRQVEDEVRTFGMIVINFRNCLFAALSLAMPILIVE